MKPHFRLLALRSSTFHCMELSDRLLASSQELSLCTFEVVPLSGANELVEISQLAGQADGLLLFDEDVQLPDPSLEIALWLSHHAGLPLLAFAPSASREDVATSNTQQMREYVAALGHPADELPVLARQPFLFARPPGEWRAALEEVSQQRALQRWSERRHKELRAIVLDADNDKNLLGVLRGDITTAAVLSSSSGALVTMTQCTALEAPEARVPANKDLFLRFVWCRFSSGERPPLLSFVTEAPKREKIRNIKLYVQRATHKKPRKATHIKLGRPLQRYSNPLEVNAVLSPLPVSPAGAILETSIEFSTTGLASCWLEGDCFQWSHRGMSGVGVIVP